MPRSGSCTESPKKDTRKLCKLIDVGYSKIDEMIRMGGKGLFTVLVYNLVDSQLCARLAKVLNPVSALFHQCRTTLNIDVMVHRRGDNFGGFVQSIHSVQIPQLKFTLDNLRIKVGPVGKELNNRLRWDPKLDPDDGDSEKWKGAPCAILSRAYTILDLAWAWSFPLTSQVCVCPSRALSTSRLRPPSPGLP